MEDKTVELKREILMGIVEGYGHKPKKIVIQMAKDKGVYKNYQSDEEVYELVKKFAEYHNKPFGHIEKIIEPDREILEVEEMIDKKEDTDYFFQSLIKERDTLSKKLLALNKLIETYKKIK